MAIVPLSASIHRPLRLRGMGQNYGFARNNLLVALLLGELSVAIHVFPIAFAQVETKLSVVGLMGFNQDGNLFIGQQNQWLGTYVPAALRAWPFGVHSSGQGNEQIITIDDSSELLNTLDGVPLFENGAPAQVLKEIIHFLQGCAQSQAQTDCAMDALIAADLLVPWEVKATLPDGQAALIRGLLKIDSEKFDRLPDADLSKLKKEGALPIIYAHFFSLNNVAYLERLAREKSPPIAPSNVNISILTDDYLKF